MCLKILRLGLVVLAGWAFDSTSSELGWTGKKPMAQRGRLKHVLLEGEHCWLGAKVQKPRAAPQHHLFGVYPSSPGNYLRPFPVGEQGTHHTGHRKPDAAGRAASRVSPDLTGSTELRREVEQPAAPWVGDGPIGQSKLLEDDDTYLGNQGSKEPLGKAALRESSARFPIATNFADLKEPEAATQRKGWAKARHPRQVVKRQAEGVPGDPDTAPWPFQPWPEDPLTHRAQSSPLEDSIQNGGGSLDWETETFNPQGGLPVLYFSGRRERLLLRPELLAEIPREAFTVEAWVRPEGGQHNPAIITGNDSPLSFWRSGVWWAPSVMQLGTGSHRGWGQNRQAWEGWSGRSWGYFFLCLFVSFCFCTAGF